jgi:hypothetical protein
MRPSTAQSSRAGVFVSRSGFEPVFGHETQKVWSSYNSVGMCDFVGASLNGLEFQPMLDYINASRAGT